MYPHHLYVRLGIEYVFLIIQGIGQKQDQKQEKNIFLGLNFRGVKEQSERKKNWTNKGIASGFSFFLGNEEGGRVGWSVCTYM